MSERVDAATYARVFEGHHEGALILEDLTRRFGGSLWVKGGIEAARETDRNLGKRAVLDFIVGMVNRANDVPPSDDEEPNAAG